MPVALRMPLCALVGYVIGSFPSADLAARVAGGEHNLHAEGTGNPGGMNAGHVLGKRWGLAVTMADVGKGTLAGRVGRQLGGDAGSHLACTAAVVGHCHPPGRAGGKGVATSLGQVIATFPIYAPVDLAVAFAASAAPWFKQRTRTATGVASATWVVCATLWWRRRLPNPGGTQAGPGLPAAALATSLVIAERFRAEMQRVEAYNEGLESAGVVVIALVTDSASQIPPTLIERFGVSVVPIVVTIDGVEYREGLDLTADEFWSRFATSGLPDMTTSLPSPGEIAAIYQAAIDRGVTEIVSVHVASAVSGVVNSAMIAADLVDAEVHVVDSGTASFGVTSCVWEAAAAVAAGESAQASAARAKAIAPGVKTSFIIQALDIAAGRGRFDPYLSEDAEEIVVLSGAGTTFEVTGSGRTVDELCDQMVDQFLAAQVPIRAGVSFADPDTLAFTEGIESRLAESDLVVDVVRYRVGPSIAAHTGPGTAGGFWWPVTD